MRLRNVLAILAVAGFAACSSRNDGKVAFLGFTPNTSLQKDTRKVFANCPKCNRAVEPGSQRCSDQKVCKAVLYWPNEYTCRYCGGDGKCAACKMMEQSEGKCYNCKGNGYLTYVGYKERTPMCPSCLDKEKGIGTGKCPTCKGTGKCDACVEGKITITALKEMVKKSAPPGEPEPGP